EPKPESGDEPEGHLDWPEEIIAQYQKKHPLGTMARVAIEAFLNNGFRVGDACRLGWWTVNDGRIVNFVTGKKRKLLPSIRINDDLRAAIDAMGGLPSVVPADAPSGVFVSAKEMKALGLAGWIRGPRGSYGTRSFSREFKRWCDEAGIPDEYSAHGLRHSVARRLMDIDGMTVEDAMKMTGHSDRKVFLHYAKKRNEPLANERASEKDAAATPVTRRANNTTGPHN